MRCHLIAALLPLIIVVACESNKDYGRKRQRDYSQNYSRSPLSYSTPTRGRTSNAGMLRQINLRRDFVSRRFSSMRPRYITIHSTQNYSGDAYAHARALHNRALGRIIWHFTVQDSVSIQHMSTTKKGNHADHDGPGNKYSIGIEMCEHRGNCQSRTLDRTAKLTAYLMKKHRIPLSNVVPHYHWPRWGKYPPNKNCPHFLMTNGRPGRKWQTFKKRVGRYYRTIG